MIDMYGSHFEFGGTSSKEYGLIIANIDTSRLTQMVGSIESNTIFNKKSKSSYLVGTNYGNSPLLFDIEIVAEDAQVVESGKRKEIEKWLFNRRNYRKLYFDDDDNAVGETYEYVDETKIRYYLNCRLINPEKIESGAGIIGYKATLEADAGWMHTDSIIKTYAVNNEAAESTFVVSVNIDTDIDDYIYPKITLQIGSVGGDIIISNNTDSSERLTKFLDLSANSSIVMDGELNFISGQHYERFSSRNFVRLLDGINNLSVIGNVSSIKIEYSARRML